ncbi:hypothetical protein MNB_SV-3-1105 [hydrothermal vent metagenome]|uniref:Porin n=1 Tax=hydrothermal vent metagenome TaxID=652676 RepID=A0A1W1C7X7_9ZZZZ
MKLTKLSLVAVLAVSSAFAGGDIAPLEPTVETPVITDLGKETTIAGKLTGYYITDDSKPFDDMFGDHAQMAAAVTLDVSHKLFENVSLNFGVTGYFNAFKQKNQTDVFGNGTGYFEGKKNGAIFNVANITATLNDTTFVLGRQLIDSPMLGGFDWLLAPGAFEAYTVVNNSISNVTLVGTYVNKYRANNSGPDFAKLSDSNYAFGAAYDDKTLNGSLWYYHIDAANYTQVYLDAGYNFGSVNVAAQYVATNYDLGKDSNAYGIKVATKLANFDLSAAYNHNADKEVGYVGRDTLYTSSWNSFAANDIGSSWKIDAATKFAGISTELSYADYNQAGNEFDAIFGYDITKSISLDAIYSNTKYAENDDASNAFEFIANYEF